MVFGIKFSRGKARNKESETLILLIQQKAGELKSGLIKDLDKNITEIQAKITVKEKLSKISELKQTFEEIKNKAGEIENIVLVLRNYESIRRIDHSGINAIIRNLEKATEECQRILLIIASFERIVGNEHINNIQKRNNEFFGGKASTAFEEEIENLIEKLRKASTNLDYEMTRIIDNSAAIARLL